MITNIAFVAYVGIISFYRGTSRSRPYRVRYFRAEEAPASEVRLELPWGPGTSGAPAV